MKHLLLICLSFISLNVISQTRCTSCSGTGGVTCGYCGGYGVVVGTVWDPYWGCYRNVQSVCTACSGYKRVVCSTCLGKGVVYSPTFRSKQSYYAECVHCNCKLYNPYSTANSYCKTCAGYGHTKSLSSSHVKRYY